MMKPDARLFDDLARMAGGAAGMLDSIRQQIKADIKARVEEMADDLDLVPREDFERLEAQVARLQLELDALKKDNK